jgi:hypothetical protein
MQMRAILRLVFCEKCAAIPKNPINAIRTRMEHQNGTKRILYIETRSVNSWL